MACLLSTLPDSGSVATTVYFELQATASRVMTLFTSLKLSRGVSCQVTMSHATKSSGMR